MIQHNLCLYWLNQSVQRGLQHTMQVTAGGDSAGWSVSQPPCAVCWGCFCPLPSLGMAIAGWSLLYWDHSSPQRCYSDQPKGSSTWLVLHHHNSFPSHIRAVRRVMGYYDIPANLLCRPLEAPGSREAVAPFVWFFPQQRSLGWLKHTCAMHISARSGNTHSWWTEHGLAYL